MIIDIKIERGNQAFELTVEVESFFEAQTQAWEFIRSKQIHFRNNPRLSFQFQSSFSYHFYRVA